MPVMINGKEAGNRKPAIHSIATQLRSSTQPAIVVDAIDLAGAAEAVHLAKAAGAVLDHAAADTIAIFQEQEWLGTTPGEAGLRADAVLIVGPVSEAMASAEAVRRLIAGGTAQRTIKIIADAGNSASAAQQLANGLSNLAPSGLSLIETLGAIRAKCGGRPVTLNANAMGAIEALAEWMKNAKYGVAVFARGALSDLEGHALTGLLDDLSETTRWTAMVVDGGPGQNELQRMTLGLTGLPQPLAFTSSGVIHDVHRFGIRNLLARQECDFVLWISASERQAPDWLSTAPGFAAITAAPAPIAGASMQLDIGIAGVDYEAVLEASELAAMVSFTPSQSGRPSAAAALREIRAALTEAKGA